MGNCLKRSRTDDISLLREDDRSAEAARRSDSLDQLPTPPPYYSSVSSLFLTLKLLVASQTDDFL